MIPEDTSCHVAASRDRPRAQSASAAVSTALSHPCPTTLGHPSFTGGHHSQVTSSEVTLVKHLKIDMKRGPTPC